MIALVQTIIAVCAAALQAAVSAEPPATQKAERTFILRPIGEVRTEGDRTMIVLDKRYQPGLLGLDGFSHIHVLWWFDRNDTPHQRAILQVHPRGDSSNPLTGVFATRAPVRPNLIAMSLCRIIAIRENVIEIDKIDAFDGTPVLDIKPYAPGLDTATAPKVPAWAKPK